MKNKNNLIWIVFILIFIFCGCSKDIPNLTTEPTVNDLIKMEDAIVHSNIQFVNLVNKVRGSVGRLGPGSKVIWSRKNDYNLGLYISANHVYNISSWSSRQESYIDLLNENNGIFLGSKIPPINGEIIFNNELIANFGLYHPEIPLSATNSSILPENDFYLGILDNQRIVDNGFAEYPNPVVTSQSLQMFDPNDRTKDAETWANITQENTVLVVGYPQDIINYPNGAVSTGKVLSDTEAELTITQLQQVGDEEGEIPYNNNVEFLTNAKAIPGMSGGGVFNVSGQLVGISVRATTLNNKSILRVVKITYIRNKLLSFYNNLTLGDKDKLRPFINGEL